MDNINCLICNDPFDIDKKIPRILINCGHTYCQECLEKQLNSSKGIICFEDNLQYFVKQIEDLPKNISLIHFLRPRNPLSKQSKKLNMNEL